MEGVVLKIHKDFDLLLSAMKSLFDRCRQLERHLGLNGGAATTATKKRRSEGRDVYVRVHNVTVTDDGNVELVYSVRVAGKPILAVTAATDMRLVSDKEVTAELGYPVLTKAERK